MIQSVFKVVHQQLENDVVSVQAEGRLDAATVSIFEQAMRQLLDGQHYRLIIDLGSVNYISSSGLRAIIIARRQARAQGGDVLLCCMSPRVRQVFDMMGFSSVFGVFDDVGQAIAVFAHTPSQGH